MEFSGLSTISSNFTELTSSALFQQIGEILFSTQNQHKKMDNVLVHLHADQQQSIENGIEVSLLIEEGKEKKKKKKYEEKRRVDSSYFI